MANYAITTENMGKQTARTAKAMSAMIDFDVLLEAQLQADGAGQITKAQKASIRKALNEADRIDAAITAIRKNMQSLLEG